MKTLCILLLATAAAPFIACSNNSNQADAEIRESQKKSIDISQSKASVTRLPDFRILSENGNTFNLSELKGKKVFVNLWASWCPPCREELPSIQKLYQSVDTNKVIFVLISIDNNFESAKHYKRTNSMMLPIYYPMESLPKLFNVGGIPATFIFNEKGELIKEIDGEDDYNSDAYKKLIK